MASTVDDPQLTGSSTLVSVAGCTSKSFVLMAYDFPMAIHVFDNARKQPKHYLKNVDRRKANLGQYYRVQGPSTNQKASKSPIILMIGGGGEKLTLKIVPEFADAYNTDLESGGMGT